MNGEKSIADGGNGEAAAQNPPGSADDRIARQRSTDL
jgi:hypothetical protein